MIRGYPDVAGVVAGDVHNPLILHVATDAPQFRVDFYRQGATLDFISSSEWQPGQFADPSGVDTDWGWPSYPFPIPVEWRSGVYIAMFVERRENGNVVLPDDATSPFGTAKALFVVRNATPGQPTCTLYKVPLNTYHAYNAGSLNDYAYPPSKVALRRPGGGVDGVSHFLENDVDPNDPRTATNPRTSLLQTFAHWDQLFVSWLEANGYVLDYCTDLDLQIDPHLLDPYSFLVSVGHDEYWSDEMFERVLAFVHRGGNVAFFGGNTCFRHVTFVDNNTAFLYDRDLWPDTPENVLTGVSYRNAGGWWGSQREAVGYRVQNSGHWIFAGTGLKDGDVFGKDSHLVGYECDGAFFPCFTMDCTDFAVPDGSDMTPKNFVILGVGLLTDGAHWNPYSREPHNNAGPRAATMGLWTAPSGGTVFTASTTDWARVLNGPGYGDSTVVQITRNVLDAMKCQSVRVIGPNTHGCEGSLAIEGQRARFRVDTTPLMGVQGLEYQWTISWSLPKGVTVDFTQPVLDAPLPSAAGPITVSVTLSVASAKRAFGTWTLSPLSQTDAIVLEMWCELLQMVQTAARSRKALVGMREGAQASKFFVDPLWDPIRGERDTVFTTQSLHAIHDRAMRLAQLVTKLLDHGGRRPG